MDESTPNSVVNGEESIAEEDVVGRSGRGRDSFFGETLSKTEMTKGSLKLRKKSGRGKEGLAEWIVNKPSRSWIGSCSKGEAENLDLVAMEHRC